MGSGKKVLHPAQCWAAITKLRDGKSITKPVTQMSLQKDDGSLCKVFNQKSVFDQSDIDKVRQRSKTTFAWLDKPPTRDEIRASVKKLGDDKSGADQSTTKF